MPGVDAAGIEWISPVRQTRAEMVTAVVIAPILVGMAGLAFWAAGLAGPNRWAGIAAGVAGEVVALTALRRWYLAVAARRSSEMAVVSADLGFGFREFPTSTDLTSVSQFPLIRGIPIWRRPPSLSANLMCRPEVLVFDYRAGSSVPPPNQTVAFFRGPALGLPDFPAGTLFSSDIDPPPADVAALLVPHPGWQVEARNGAVLIYRRGHLCVPSTLPAFLTATATIAADLARYAPAEPAP